MLIALVISRRIAGAIAGAISGAIASPIRPLVIASAPMAVMAVFVVNRLRCDINRLTISVVVHRPWLHIHGSRLYVHRLRLRVNRVGVADTKLHSRHTNAN